MGRIFTVDLEGRNYKCRFCKTSLALADEIISRAFRCRRGKAYLFNKAVFITNITPQTSPLGSPYLSQRTDLGSKSGCSWVNITVGPHEERMMLSGIHTVADIYCCCCGQILGWKYEAAHEKIEKYKEGKYVLERARIIDSLDSEFYMDTRPSTSDGEDV